MQGACVAGVFCPLSQCQKFCTWLSLVIVSLLEFLNSESSMCLCFLLLGSLKQWEVVATASCTGFHKTAFLFSKDESRIKATVMDVKPVDYREYGKRLIMGIRRNAVM